MEMRFNGAIYHQKAFEKSKIDVIFQKKKKGKIDFSFKGKKLVLFCQIGQQTAN